MALGSGISGLRVKPAMTAKRRIAAVLRAHAAQALLCAHAAQALLCAHAAQALLCAHAAQAGPQ